MIQEANDRAQAYRVYIEWALKQTGRAGRPISFRGAAIRLNERDIETPLGGSWRGHHIQRMARRLGIDHPLARMPESFARARVRALYKLRPDLTCEELVATMGTAHPLWNRRAYALLKECRRDAAKRSPVTGSSGGISITEPPIESALASSGSGSPNLRESRSWRSLISGRTRRSNGCRRL